MDKDQFKNEMKINTVIALFCIFCSYCFLATKELSWKITEWHKYAIIAFIVASGTLIIYAILFSIFTSKKNK